MHVLKYVICPLVLFFSSVCLYFYIFLCTGRKIYELGYMYKYISNINKNCIHLIGL